MSEIHQYKPGDLALGTMEWVDDGGYVRFTDYKAEIDRLTEELAAARAVDAKLPRINQLDKTGDEPKLVQDVPVVPGITLWY